MYIILSYDISSKKGKRIVKACERELVRVQKSVFEGEITYKRLEFLKEHIKKTVDPVEDSVIIYYADTFGRLKKEQIGKLIKTDQRFL